MSDYSSKANGEKRHFNIQDIQANLWKRSGLSGPVSFAITIVAIIFVMSVFLRVEEIYVEGNTHYTDEEIIRAIDIEEGDNLFFFDRFGMLSRVFAKLPYIREVSVERTLPNKVTITVEESEALAYLVLGEEKWTLDQNCKVLGKAAEGETAFLIPIEGIKPGTLLIGEDMETEDKDSAVVSYLADVLYQIEERGLRYSVTGIDFSDPKNVNFSYAGRYNVVLGKDSNTEYKFGMFVSVLSKLKEGDVGVINLSDGNTASFIPR